MEITEALQKEVEAFLFNEFNIEIYDRKKEWKNLFNQLEFYNLLYKSKSQSKYLSSNCDCELFR